MGWGNRSTADLKRDAATRRALTERASAAERDRDTAQLEVRRLTTVLAGVGVLASRALPPAAPPDQCAWCWSAYVDCPWHPTVRTEPTT